MCSCNYHAWTKLYVLMSLPSLGQVYAIALKKKNCNNGKESIIVWKVPDANYDKIRFAVFSTCTSKPDNFLLGKVSTMQNFNSASISLSASPSCNERY